MNTLMNFQILDNPGLYDDYEHTIDFDNLQAQTGFWTGKVLSEFNNTKVNIVNDNIFKVKGSYDALKNASYCRAQLAITINDITTIKYFYYFITDIKLLATNDEQTNQVVQLHVEKDVMQSNMFDIEIKESFVEREHQDRFIKNETTLPQFNILNEPELNIGENYKIHEEELQPDYVTGNNFITSVQNWERFVSKNVAFVVVACKTKHEVDSSVDYETKVSFDGLYYYCAPFFTDKLLDRDEYANTNFVARWSDIEDGVTTEHHSNLMHAFELLEWARTNGTDVVNVYFTNFLPLPIKKVYFRRITEQYVYKYYFEFEIEGYNFDTQTGYPFARAGISKLGSSTDYAFSLAVSDNYNNYAFKTFQELTGWNFDDINNIDINNDKDINFEPKLHTFPYEFSKITNHRVETAPIKHEFLQLEQSNEIGCQMGVSDSQKSAWWVKNYKVESPKFSMTIDNTSTKIPLVIDNWNAYIAQHQATATQGYALNKGITIAQGTIGAGFGVAGIIAGAVGGGAVGAGAIAGGSGGIIGSILSTINKIKQVDYQREDIRKAPPSILNAGNDAGFDVGMKNLTLKHERYELQDKFKKKIFEWFYRFGYQANELKIPELRSRYYFNYIQMNANLKANLNVNELRQIKQIYANGITLWHYRDANTFRFNDYTKENVEMALL